MGYDLTCFSHELRAMLKTRWCIPISRRHGSPGTGLGPSTASQPASASNQHLRSVIDSQTDGGGAFWKRL